MMDYKEIPESSLQCSIEPSENSSINTAIITIPAVYIQKLFKEAILNQQQSLQTYGFSRGKVPLDYIEQHFKTTITEHIQEFLYRYTVNTYLYKEINKRKILIAGTPRLSSVFIEPNKDAVFKFEFSQFPTIELHEWKYFPFKAPKRKKYKDLDRQVESFIHEEKENMSQYTSPTVALGDWLSIDVMLIDAQGNPILENYKENLWLKIGDEEADSTLRDIFIGKHVNETFCTSNKALQDYFSSSLDLNYNFCIHIVDIIPHAYFCLESFRRYFKIKSHKEMYQKLIEVFSYRNDLSQRRSMVEETFKLLLAKHHFNVPKHLILRQQAVVLKNIQATPDYHVYRMQKDFKEHVHLLAEKQIKEALIIDQIAYDEDIQANVADIKTYLNLMKRPRTKEFIYFIPPVSKIRGQEIPISMQELVLACTREKTLNHVIYHLTQK